MRDDDSSDLTGYTDELAGVVWREMEESRVTFRLWIRVGSDAVY